MGDPIKNLKFYQQFGFEQYVLCNEDCQEFFKWFSANITEDNILTESEISQYNDLVNEGSVLHGSELECELNRLNEEYPNILSYTERNVQQLEAQLERFVLLEERNENHLAEMKYVITNTSKKMLMLESEIAQCEQEEQTNVRNCFENGKQLQDLQSTNQKSLLDVNQLFNKSQKPSLFIYQMPLDQYFQKCDQFLKFLEVYLHNNFKVQNFFEQNSEDDECSRLQMCRDLEDIKDRLYQKELKILNLNLNNSGIKAMIQTLKSNQLEPMSWSTLNGTIEQYSQQIQVNNMNIETVKSSIEHQLQLLTEQEIHFIVHQNNLEKLERATNRLNFLKNLSDTVSNSLLNAEMLWILMQLDMEKIDEWNKCEKLEEYRNEAQLCLKRMESMNHIIKSPIDNQLNAIIFQDLKNLLTNTLHIADEKLHDLRSCFMEFEKLTKTFSNDLNKFAAATHNDLESFKKAYEKMPN